MYFAYEGFDCHNGTNHLAIKLLDYLLNEGFDIYLLTSHTTGENPDIPSIFHNRERFRYDIVRRKVVDKKNFIWRYISGMKYAFSCRRRWMKEKKNLDAIILQSTPTVFFSSVLLKLFFKGKVILNSYDVFPNVAFDSGILKGKFVYKVFSYLQKRVYKYCTKIIVISSDMMNTLIREGVEKDKIIQINNWYDDDNVRQISPNENSFIKKYNLSSDLFYIQYAGNFGYTFDYNFVIEVADALQSNKQIVFHMIGDGARQDEFVHIVGEKKLNNIDFIPWQPSNMISDVYSACDLALIPLAKDVIKNSYPSKCSLLMACGKTVICATEENSDFYNTINSNCIGVCVSNRNPQHAAEIINNLFLDRRKLATIGQNAKKYGDEHYSSSACLPKFKELLKELIER
ncbi:MAG: glycosyltransferase family 4 protein [Candidatus Izemoplasmatales bacterium]